MRFIRTPPTTTIDISTNLAHLERDIHLKVFFNHYDTKTTTNTPPKLYVKSKWKPLQNDIPPWVDSRFNKFLQHMMSLFRARRSRPNLLPFQSSTLNAPCSDTNLLFPDTDKGLGPCAVTYEQYVQDGLVHLTDAATFKCVSPTEAHSAAHALVDSILTWINTHRRTLTPHTYGTKIHHPTHHRQQILTILAILHHL